MSNIRLDVDKGKDFGRWTDPVSKFLYFDSMSLFLEGIDLSDYSKIADYGGANGLLKKFIPNALSIDYDPKKKPDIVDDILTHKGDYDLIVIRYVLHYLSNEEIQTLFHNLRDYTGEIWIIQFASDGQDNRIKRANSRNEGTKYFRDTFRLFGEVEKHISLIESKAQSIDVTTEFYINRLENPEADRHYETIYFLRGYIR